MFTATVTAAATISASEQVSTEKLNLLGVPTVAIDGTADAADISDSAVTTVKLNDGAVTNAKVAADAGIELSKLEIVEGGKLVAGSNVSEAEAHDLTGDVSLRRAINLTVTNMTTGVLSVGNKLQVGSLLYGTVVKLGTETSVGGSLYKRNVFIDTGSTFSMPSTAVDVYRQPSTMVVKHTSATRPFSLGSTLAGATASARVLTCSAGVLGVAIPDVGAYLYTVTLDTVSGVFTAGESLTIDGAVSALTVQAASGRETIGATLVVAGVTEWAQDTLVLAATVDEPTPTPFVTANEVRTASGDIAGKVLTSAGAFLAPTWQTPTISTPLMRGGVSPFLPENWVGGSTTAYVGIVHASAWEVQGWQLSGSDYFVYLYNANFNTGTLSANKGEIAVDDVITIFPKTTPVANPFETEQAVATEATGVASAYAAYKVLSVTARASGTVGALGNVREVKLVRVSDNTPVTWNTATYPTSTSTTTSKAFAGRKAFAPTGGIVFKCGEVASTGLTRTDPPTTGGAATGGGAYVAIFNTEAASTNYAVNIAASGQYEVGVTLGNTAATQYNGGMVIPTYRSTRRVHFNYQCIYAGINGATFRYEPRDMSVLVYEP